MSVPGMVRLVVTGGDASGTATVVSDNRIAGVPSGILAGGEMVRLWAVDRSGEGWIPAADQWTAAPGEGRAGVFSVPPRTTGPGGPETMHATPTVDVVVVLSGALTLRLEDGPDVVLGPGDVVIQNGTRHAWENDGDSTATAAVVMLGVVRTARHPPGP